MNVISSRRIAAISVLISVSAVTGCASIAGHKLTITDGKVESVTNVKGLPIVVQNPTRAMFVLTKATYDVVRVRASARPDGVVSEIREDVGPVVEMTLSDEPILLGPSEIYTIDPKRPFAGTTDYTIELENQYPKKFAGKLDDKTLEQFEKLAKDLAEVALKVAVPAPAPAGVVKEAGAAVSIERTLRSKEVKLVILVLATGEITIEDL